MYRVHLSEDQLTELLRLTRDASVKPRTRNRLEMVRLAHAGWSAPRIAAYLQQSPRRVRFWLRCFLEGGFDALPDQPHLGQQSTLTPALLEALRVEFAQGDRTWTAPQIADWLAEHHGVRLCSDWLGRLLKRARLSYKRTQRRLKHQQDPAAVAAKQAELRDLEKGERPVDWTSATSTKQGSRPPRRLPIVGDPSGSD